MASPSASARTGMGADASLRSASSRDGRVGILQVCDSLDAGGLERVAVNVANRLPSEKFRSYLCATRSEGPLAELVEPHVTYLGLRRRSRYDVRSIQRLGAFVRDHEIRILHAHGTALFLAVAAASLAPGASVLWHDHFGRFRTETRPAWLYGLAARRARGVIAVNRPLVDWAVQKLRIDRNRVWYLPNFVCEEPARSRGAPLPGSAGRRIVCIANLRPEKDHATLLRAMAIVAGQVPDVHLLSVGDARDASHAASLQALTDALHLRGQVSFLGSRSDVPAILASCDIGVLSSVSEGLPLALLEYGLAGLPAVATDVGACAEVLDAGRAGIVVPPGQPEALARALGVLLASPEERARLGREFQSRCRAFYGAEAGIGQIVKVYEALLA